MLAQNFKSHADLGISDVEFSALITVLGMLERGEIPERAFTMRNYRPTYTREAEKIAEECGTIGCLCGWANFVSAGQAFPQAVKNDSSFATPAIERLFAIMTDTDGISARVWKTATVESAATALRSYLTTGEANWAEALGPQ